MELAEVGAGDEACLDESMNRVPLWNMTFTCSRIL